VLRLRQLTLKIFRAMVTQRRQRQALQRYDFSGKPRFRRESPSKPLKIKG
jgi:hypothetical protein